MIVHWDRHILNLKTQIRLCRARNKVLNVDPGDVLAFDYFAFLFGGDGGALLDFIPNTGRLKSFREFGGKIRPSAKPTSPGGSS